MNKAIEHKVTSFEEIFSEVEVNRLSENDRFLKEYNPENEKEKWLKDCILEAIRKRIPNFRTYRILPSEENGNIVFENGRTPAVGRHITWWVDRVKMLFPGKNARTGTDLQYAAWIGEIMKTLLKKGIYSNVREVWKAVCVDSRNMKIDKLQWGDFTSSGKIFKKHDANDFLLAKGFKNSNNDCFNLVDIIKVFPFNGNFSDAVLFIVTDV